MAPRKSQFNPVQFKETHIVRGTPVNILNETGLGDLVGMKARVHMHTPATEALGRPIYSVLVGGKVFGHTEDIYLKDSAMKVDKKQLEKHLANPESKTRNTFVSGIVAPPPIEPADRALKIRPGLMEDAKTGEDVSGGMAGVRLNANGAKYKPIV